MSKASVANSGIDVSNLRHFDRERLIYDSDLKPGERHVLLAINSFVGSDGRCFPRQSVLADMTGYSRKTVNETLGRLESQGIIAITHRFRSHGRGQTSNDYFVDWGSLAARSRISGGVTKSHTQVSKNVTPLGVTKGDTSNYPDELPTKLTDQNTDKRQPSGTAAPPDQADLSERDSQGETEHTSLSGSLDQAGSQKIDASKKEVPPPRRDFWTPTDGLATDKQGWVKLPTTTQVVPKRREAVSRAKAQAVRDTQLWLVDQGIRGIEWVEEDGVELIEHLNGTETAEEAFGRGGDLSLRKLRDLALDQCLITQEEFNATLEDFFWEALAGEQVA